MEKAQDIWNQILFELNKNYDPDLINEAFGSAKVISENNSLITIMVDTMYIQTKINKFYFPSINNIAQNLFSTPLRFKFITKDDLLQKTEPDVYIQKSAFESNLNPSYNFESFIVGDSNKFAQRTAYLAASQPGTLYNPLYIFGGVGIGKTHLMQSIGNYILDQDINKKVLYVRSQDYINEYSKAAQSHDMSKFEEKYSNLDLLLVDDIQMLSNAKKSQETFFNLFQTMYDNQKQIVITSDRPTNQLKDIMDRLTTRFSWGMQIDINKPDLPLRVRILKRKLYETSADENSISDEILQYIASLYENIRDLEGCLRRVLAYAAMLNVDVNMDIVKESLSSLISSKNDDINSANYDNLKSIIADFYNISVDDLIGKKRNSHFVTARHLTAYILKTKYKLTNNDIGKILGGKDHSTITTAIAKMEEEIKNNEELSLSYNTILKKIN